MAEWVFLLACVMGVSTTSVQSCRHGPSCPSSYLPRAGSFHRPPDLPWQLHSTSLSGTELWICPLLFFSLPRIPTSKFYWLHFLNAPRPSAWSLFQGDVHRKNLSLSLSHPLPPPGPLIPSFSFVLHSIWHHRYLSCIPCTTL